MNKRFKFEEPNKGLPETAKHEERDESSDDEDDSSSEPVDEKLPVLRSIVDDGTVASAGSSKTLEDIDRDAIRQELSALSFEELQKLKEKIGSKKFQKTLNGSKQARTEKSFKRANPNRPREMSSKIRVVQPKPVFQIPKTFKNDPRFDNMCGEFNEQKFHRNYEFITKMKEEELQKLKEELKEESNPKQIDKIKYLIQRTENQLKADKKRKEEEEKQLAEKQEAIEAYQQGKTPYFLSKGAKREKELREKFDNLKKDGRLDKYMAKKRKHNSQRDRKYLPMSQ